MHQLSLGTRPLCLRHSNPLLILILIINAHSRLLSIMAHLREAINWRIGLYEVLQRNSNNISRDLLRLLVKGTQGMRESRVDIDRLQDLLKMVILFPSGGR